MAMKEENIWNVDFVVISSLLIKMSCLLEIVKNEILELPKDVQPLGFFIVAVIFIYSEVLDIFISILKPQTRWFS